MSNRVDAQRRDVAFSVLGGPTTVVDIGGRRIVMDPTFDQPGPHDYLTKTVGPAVPAAALGSIDVVLVSHDEHPDNFDREGRQLALSASLVLTHTAPRAGSGRRPWGSSHSSLSSFQARMMSKLLRYKQFRPYTGRLMVNATLVVTSTAK